MAARLPAVAAVLVLALAASAHAIPKAPNPNSALDAAKVAMGEGRYGEALATVDSFSATGEAEARRLFLKGRILARSGDAAGAIEQLRGLAANLTAESAPIYLESLEGEKDFAKARDDLAFEGIRAGVRRLVPEAARPRILGKAICFAETARCAAKVCPAGMIAVKRVKPAPACRRG